MLSIEDRLNELDTVLKKLRSHVESNIPVEEVTIFGKDAEKIHDFKAILYLTKLRKLISHFILDLSEEGNHADTV